MSIWKALVKKVESVDCANFDCLLRNCDDLTLDNLYSLQEFLELDLLATVNDLIEEYENKEEDDEYEDDDDEYEDDNE